MYLVGRVISLMIFVAVMFISCYIVSRSKKSIGTRYLTLYVVVLGLMGFCFIPHVGADLYRIYNTMAAYASLDIGNLLNRISSVSTPGVPLYYFLVGQLGNKQWLPCISAIITFSFCFSLLKKELKNEKTYPIYVAIALFAFMSRGLMLQIISNIRTLMALAIVAWCIYEEFYEKKKPLLLIIPYLLAASLHAMGQVMLLYRVAYLVMGKAKSPIQRILSVSLAAVAGGVVCFFGQSYISALFDKADSYVSYAQAGTGYSYGWERLLSVLSLLLTVYLISRFYKYKKLELLQDRCQEDATSTLVAFMIPLIAADCVMFFVEFNFFQRLSWFITIATIPLLISVLRMSCPYGKDKIIGRNILIYSFFVLFIACARGDLCSLKFFLL